MEIRHHEGAKLPSFGLDRASRDALAVYARRTWPANTAKHAALAWDLTLDEAKGLVAARASQATIDKVWKRGGWEIALPVLGAVIGQDLAVFLTLQRTRHRHERRELEALDQRRAEMVRHLRSTGPVGLGFGGGLGDGRDRQRSGRRG